jgi:predicted AlkP superfamily pyrophosphatase or phosphodiesterase
MPLLRKTLLNAAATFAAAALFAQGALAQAPAATPAPASAPAAQHPRNIIFVLVDDLRFDGMGFLQPKGLLHTPNIDAMAAQGTYFPNGVTTSSLCSPARASILTGMTARNHGVVDNNNSTERA